ncbi:MAG: SRPBCC family protein [Phycisphaerae bacterium]
MGNEKLDLQMTTHSYSVDIDATLEDVWAFHEDIERALPVMSPPEADARVESIEGYPPAGVGTAVTLTVKGPVGRMRWQARYAEHRPPHADGAGRVAWFVDEQVKGPFKQWRHRHEMRELPGGKCRLTETVWYDMPGGLVGRTLGGGLVRRQIEGMFEHRKTAVKEAVEAGR